MAEAAPQGTPAKPGTIPISAVNSAQKQNVPQKENAQRSSAAGKLKVVVRRLPPSLTQQEFETTLGQEWLQGKGKVSWMRFVSGKVSKDAAKPPRPACCYLHLTGQPHFEGLVSHLRTLGYYDGQVWTSDPALVAKPEFNFALFQRVPANKKRNDARQGLIDQDPEFIEFLESLTNPLQKSQNVEALLKDEDAKGEKVTTTPLIQHLREKKAAKEKAKENKGKAHGRNTSKAETESKAETKAAAKEEKKGNERSNRRGGKQDAQKKDATPAAASPKPQAASPAKQDSKSAAQASKKSTTPSATPTAARIIQRDLGIRGGRGGSPRKQGGRADNKNAPAADGAESKSNNQTPAAAHGNTRPGTPASTTAVANNNKSVPPVAPSAVLKRQSGAPPATVQSSNASKSATLSNASGTSAFLKHANPSQGITEPLIQAALSTFGPVKSVEIDKRKGFAFVEFGDTQSLTKAVAQGTVKVAQGNVLVLERKDRAATNTPSSGGNNAAGSAASNKGTTATSAPTPTQPASAPSAMRAEQGSRGGSANRFRGGRGGRGGGGRGRASGPAGGNQAGQQPVASAPPAAPANANAIKAGT